MLQQQYRVSKNAFPVQSLLDVDFYKFTMLNFIWTYYPQLTVRYECINRNKTIPVARIVSESALRAALDYARTLRFTDVELQYLYLNELYGTRLFSGEFIDFLRQLRLPSYELSIEGDQYVLGFEGSWLEVELWETIALATIFELYSGSLLARMTGSEQHTLYSRATDALEGKLALLRGEAGLLFSDFGLRRRHSAAWQEMAVKKAQTVMGYQFLGTSNVRLAAKYGLMPIGTNAHSLTMATMAAVFDGLFAQGNFAGIQAMQYKLAAQWQELYDMPLRIALPDAYGTEQYLTSAPEWLAREWRGIRQDSGNPFEVGELILDWYRAQCIGDPKTEGKIIIFSDGLTADRMVELYRAFSDRINVGFGWGTHFTNGFDGLHPTPEKQVPGLEGTLWGEMKWAFSMVCKVVAANGRPAVKLPDNINKATGPLEERERYMEVFGRGGRTREETVV